MKKFFKVLAGVGAIVGGVAGVVYFLNRKKDDALEDFDDEDFDDIFAEDDEEEDRDYVTLDIEKEEKTEASETTEEKDAEPVSSEA